jgi:hypothetical protein
MHFHPPVLFAETQGKTETKKEAEKKGGDTGKCLFINLH